MILGHRMIGFHLEIDVAFIFHAPILERHMLNSPLIFVVEGNIYYDSKQYNKVKNKHMGSRGSTQEQVPIKV